MNLDDLNESLFRLFDDIKEDRVDTSKAQAMTNIANTIINTAKVQLQGIKQLQDSGIVPLTMKDSSPKMLGDLYDQKSAFAKKLGYQNVAEAIGKMGKEQFNKLYEKQGN